MSVFEELENCFVQVCRDTERRPIQWIYSVDDAWFHPQSFKLEEFNSTQSNSEKKLNKPIWQGFCNKTISANDALKALADTDSSSSISVESTTFAPLSAAGDEGARSGLPLAERIDDAAVAKKLIKFSTEDNDYGLCFCSFEYLWTNFMVSINGPQNAILFDINHQIAGVLQEKLREKWTEKIKVLDLFQDETANDPKLYGWLLHFAIKFGKLGSCNSQLSPNHLLLVSSAIAGKGGASEDAMTQYLQVQLSMWEKLSGDKNYLEQGRMLDFSFAPLPKVTGSGTESANLLDTGLKIFNNTFKDAAKWEVMRKLLLQDMIYLWDQKAMGHDAGVATMEELRCDGWIEPDKRSDLRGTHHFHNYVDDGQENISAKSLLGFLQRALMQPNLNLPEDAANWELLFPTNPGISYLIGIADLYTTMCNLDNHNDRNAPIVSLNVSDNALKVCFKIDSEGVKKLEAAKCKDDKVAEDKSAGAMQRVYRGSHVLVRHLDELNQGYLDKQYHAEDCLTNINCNCPPRRKVLEDECCGELSTICFCKSKNIIAFKFFKPA